MGTALLTTASMNANLVRVGSAAIDMHYNMEYVSLVESARGAHRYITWGSTGEWMTASAALPRPLYRFIRFVRP